MRTTKLTQFTNMGELRTVTARKRHNNRCDRCFMRPELCICQDIITAGAPFSLSTQITLITHYRELRKPTNTGRLAELCLDNCRIFSRGQEGSQLTPKQVLSSKKRNLFLYPGDSAISLKEALDHFEGPFNLIVPDGNWRQASKVHQRENFLSTLPLVKISSHEESQYKLRKEPKENGLATFEAIARAIGELESTTIQRKMEELFDIMVSRSLKSRGVKI